MAAAVAAHEVAIVAALGLSGAPWPPVVGFVALVLVSDAALNVALAYAVGGAILGLVLVREKA